MYLHLGQETVVKKTDVIGIFDLDTATVSKRTREYLAKAEQAGNVISVTYELPKTFVVCRDPTRPRGRAVYLSQLASATLLKRASIG